MHLKVRTVIWASPKLSFVQNMPSSEKQRRLRRERVSLRRQNQVSEQKARNRALQVQRASRHRQSQRSVLAQAYRSQLGEASPLHIPIPTASMEAKEAAAESITKFPHPIEPQQLPSQKNVSNSCEG